MARAPQVLRGMRDFLPEQMILRQHVLSTFRGVFEHYGFEPIETPVIEYLETLTGKYGEDEKLIYSFQDRGERDVGLRYDLTVPLARFVANHRNELTFPFKRYHIAPVFRADRPQRGRYREFWQCDADIVGTRSMMADAEVVSVWIDALSAINMPGFVVHINHRKLLMSLASVSGVPDEQTPTIHRAIDKLAKIGEEGVLKEMQSNGISEEAARLVLDLVSIRGEPGEVFDQLSSRLAGNQFAEEGLAELRALFTFLEQMGADSSHYALDLTLARGLDYYTGPVFEAMSVEANIGSLGGAGRYDGLVGMFSGEDLPATGCSLGLERIFDVIQEQNLVKAPSTVSQALVTIFNEDTVGASLSLVGELRRSGVPCEIFVGEKYDLRRQLQFANRKGIPTTIILGPDEIASGQVVLREMESGEQKTVARSGLADTISPMIRSNVR
ncbi:MAG: histidine--tRNA ligase [Thermomicrobiaceae bacterium]